MKIVIGFDDTIFNTYKLIKNILDNLKKAGYKSEEFQEIYKKAKQKKVDFNQREVVTLLEKLDFNNKSEVVQEMVLLLKNAEKFIYPDFYRFVDNFKKKDLILLSSGKTSLQKKKIENSKISNYFDKVFVTEDKIKKLELIYKKYSRDRLFFIDDRPSDIDQAERLMLGIVTLKMERARGVYTKQSSSKTNFEIRNFSQAKKIIQELTNK
ncbi:HAD hydrolase-like protein [Patescibacteria group bacterium]|nr:HAD hydrolase-like protein [Patescibacteria group bacterium]